MNVFSRLCGGFHILLASTALIYAGCSAFSHSDKACGDYVPCSNRLVAETVIKRAFEDLDFPNGKGEKISLKVEGTGGADEYAKLIAPEFLSGKGFYVSRRHNSIPGISVSVDTLYVKLTTERSKGMARRVSRSAEARIDVVLHANNGAVRVYRGRGVYQDDFPVSMMDAVGMNEPYVTVSDRFVSNFKPVLFSVTITLFLWYLYSFRG